MLHVCDCVFADVVFVHGDATKLDLSDATMWFANSTCFDKPVRAANTCAHIRCETRVNSALSTYPRSFLASLASVIQLMAALARTSAACQVGCFGITTSKRLPCDKWELLERHSYAMSWGPGTVYIQRKARA